MKLTKLQLENFRNYKKKLFKFAENNDLTVLVGPNGIGKTNFLEAIYVLSLGKSFRSLFQDQMIKWDDDYMRLKGEIFSDNEKTALEVFCSSRPGRQKSFKRNGVNLKNSEYLGHLLTVLFQPEDLNMLYQGPSLRRRYVDILLSQTDRKYLKVLLKYKKILRQRNALLNAIRHNQLDGKDDSTLIEDLDVWDKELTECGSEIIDQRLKMVEFFGQRLGKIYRSISAGKENLTMEYKSKILQQTSKKPLIELYGDEFFNRRKRDIFRGETTAGPHRDDLVFFLDGREISNSASRGEVRTLLLVLKLIEIEYIKSQTGKNPVLLLDDVFSELDRKRQKHLIKSIRGCQTIITTTDTEKLEEIGGEKITMRFASDQ